MVIVRTLFLVPLYLKYISLEEYGAWIATGGVLSVLTVMDLGLMGVLSQQCAVTYGAGNRSKLKILIGTGVSVSALLSLIAAIIAVAIAPVLPYAMRLEGGTAERVYNCFILAGVANGLSLFAFSLSGIIKSFQRTFATGLFLFISEIANIGLTLYLLLSDFGLYAIGWGLLGRSTLLCLCNGCWSVAIFNQERLGQPIWVWQEAKRLWNLSTYTFAEKAASCLVAGSDNFLIGILIGPEASGIYSLTTRAHDIVRSLAGNFSTALMPALSHMRGEGNPEGFRHVILVALKFQIAIAVSGIGGVIAFNSAFVELWIGSEMFAGEWVNLFFGMWAMGYIVRGVGWQILFSIGEIPFLCKVAWLETFVRIILSLLLIPMIGIIGAPIGAFSAQWAGPLLLMARKVLTQLGIETKYRSKRFAKHIITTLLIPLFIAIVFSVLPHQYLDWISFAKMVLLYILCSTSIMVLLNRSILEYANRYRKKAAVRHNLF